MNDAIVGKQDHLLDYLTDAASRAERIRFNVAFLMESGARLISPCLEDAVSRGVGLEVLTGRYMSVTEPAAIYYLMDRLGNRLDIRFFSEPVRSFHPKAYIFDYGEEAEVFIGSSNLSRSALTFGLEWNYCFRKSQNPEAYEKFSAAFTDLFHNSTERIDHEVLKKYTAGWRKPYFVKVEQAIEHGQEDEAVYPRGAQIEALYELKNARREGVVKGLVIAATGVGKTYLAAFDSAGYRRVLFLAHREEILRQAETSFMEVSPRLKTGYFTGYQKEEGANVYFASVQTLSRQNHLHTFTPDFFDYIIVDEFHHAAADSYQAILDYFHPRFLLGLTATPFRMDNRDIFALCEDNVIYELYLKDAINRDLLAPFLYYGIYDAVDYDQVECRHGKYVLDDLERELSRKERADLVLEKYNLLAGTRTLGFCVSIKHAEYMADYFNEQGIPAACVHSGPVGSPHFLSRAEAVEALNNGDVKALFAVDIFNEGLDIPSLDTVMFLRPTESYVVFLQQLGRGLRKDQGKKHLVVLDFIGNYKRAHYVPALLAGENPMDPRKTGGKKAYELEYPESCQVHFDFQLLDLFERMARADPLKKRMMDVFYAIKDSLGRRPSRTDILNGSDIHPREFLKKGWLNYLHELEELELEEEEWLGTVVEEFLVFLEKTPMTKAYKVPTIRALLDGDELLHSVPLQRVGEYFRKFYVDTPLHQKDLSDRSNAGWESWNLSHFSQVARRNPVHFLSRGKFFHYDEINQVFSLDDSLKPFLGPMLASHVKDILEYRRVLYFKRRFKDEEL